MTAGSTYTPIATATATGSQNTITFSSIPSTYTDLILVTQIAFGVDSVSIGMILNSDTSANYSYTYLLGNGSAASSGRSSNLTTGIAFGYVATAGQTTISNVNIQNYTSTTAYKAVLNRDNNAGNRAQFSSQIWRSTAVINRLDLITSSGNNYNSGSTFTLYGIAAA